MKKILGLLMVCACLLDGLVYAGYDPVPQSAEDTAHVDAEKLVRVACRRIDTAAASGGTTGDWITEDCDSNGEKRTSELPAPAALADATANPTVSGIASYMMCFNGTTWDRCLTGLTDTDDASIAFSQVPHLSVNLGYMSNGTTWTRLLGNATDGLLVNLGTNNDVTVTSGAITATLAAETTKVIGTVNPGNTANTTPWLATVTSLGEGGTADAIATAGSTGSTNAKLRLLTNLTIDPCSSTAKIFVPISQTTGTQIVTGTASNRTYVCSIHVMSATAQNIALVSGTGTVCATSTGAMIGGTTAATGWNFAANSGVVLGDGKGAVAKSDTDADNICLLMSSTGQLSGVMSYVVAAN